MKRAWVIDIVLGSHFFSVFHTTPSTCSDPDIDYRLRLGEFFQESWAKHPMRTRPEPMPDTCPSWGLHSFWLLLWLFLGSLEPHAVDLTGRDPSETNSLIPYEVKVDKPMLAFLPSALHSILFILTLTSLRNKKRLLWTLAITHRKRDKFTVPWRFLGTWMPHVPKLDNLHERNICQRCWVENSAGYDNLWVSAMQPHFRSLPVYPGFWNSCLVFLAAPEHVAARLHGV